MYNTPAFVWISSVSESGIISQNRMPFATFESALQAIKPEALDQTVSELLAKGSAAVEFMSVKMTVSI